MIMDYDLGFEAEDCNDENWEIIIKILKENLPNFKVTYGFGDNMTFYWNKEVKQDEQKTRKKI